MQTHEQASDTRYASERRYAKRNKAAKFERRQLRKAKWERIFQIFNEMSEGKE